MLIAAVRPFRAGPRISGRSLSSAGSDHASAANESYGCPGLTPSGQIGFGTCRSGVMASPACGGWVLSVSGQVPGDSSVSNESKPSASALPILTYYLMFQGHAYTVSTEIVPSATAAKTGQVHTQTVVRLNCSGTVDTQDPLCDAIYPSYVFENTILSAYGVFSIVRGSVAARATAQATGRETIVIGEDMAGRVIPTAKARGAGWYDPPSAPPEKWMQNQRDWINQRMDEGCTILDCGAAPGRANFPDPTSPYYQTELDEILRRGYMPYERIPAVGE